MKRTPKDQFPASKVNGKQQPVPPPLPLGASTNNNNYDNDVCSLPFTTGKGKEKTSSQFHSSSEQHLLEDHFARLAFLRPAATPDCIHIIHDAGEEQCQFTSPERCMKQSFCDRIDDRVAVFRRALLVSWGNIPIHLHYVFDSITVETLKNYIRNLPLKHGNRSFYTTSAISKEGKETLTHTSESKTLPTRAESFSHLLFSSILRQFKLWNDTNTDNSVSVSCYRSPCGDSTAAYLYNILSSQVNFEAVLLSQDCDLGMMHPELDFLITRNPSLKNNNSLRELPAGFASIVDVQKFFEVSLGMSKSSALMAYLVVGTDYSLGHTLHSNYNKIKTELLSIVPANSDVLVDSSSIPAPELSAKSILFSLHHFAEVAFKDFKEEKTALLKTMGAPSNPKELFEHYLEGLFHLLCPLCYCPLQRKLVDGISCARWEKLHRELLHIQQDPHSDSFIKESIHFYRRGETELKLQELMNVVKDDLNQLPHRQEFIQSLKYQDSCREFTEAFWYYGACIETFPYWKENFTSSDFNPPKLKRSNAPLQYRINRIDNVIRFSEQNTSANRLLESCNIQSVSKSLCCSIQVLSDMKNEYRHLLKIRPSCSDPTPPEIHPSISTNNISLQLQSDLAHHPILLFLRKIQHSINKASKALRGVYFTIFRLWNDYLDLINRLGLGSSIGSCDSNDALTVRNVHRIRRVCICLIRGSEKSDSRKRGPYNSMLIALIIMMKKFPTRKFTTAQFLNTDEISEENFKGFDNFFPNLVHAEIVTKWYAEIFGLTFRNRATSMRVFNILEDRTFFEQMFWITDLQPGTLAKSHSNTQHRVRRIISLSIRSLLVHPCDPKSRNIYFDDHRLNFLSSYSAWYVQKFSKYPEQNAVYLRFLRSFENTTASLVLIFPKRIVAVQKSSFITDSESSSDDSDEDECLIENEVRVTFQEFLLYYFNAQGTRTKNQPRSEKKSSSSLGISKEDFETVMHRFELEFENLSSDSAMTWMALLYCVVRKQNSSFNDENFRFSPTINSSRNTCRMLGVRNFFFLPGKNFEALETVVKPFLNLKSEDEINNFILSNSMKILQMFEDVPFLHDLKLAVNNKDASNMNKHKTSHLILERKALRRQRVIVQQFDEGNDDVPFANFM